MLKNKKNIQIGYKESELGIIPEDWDVVRIKHISTVITGSTPPTIDKSNYGREYMFVSPGDLGNSKYINATEKMLSKKGFNLSRKLPKGTILFTCIGSTIGKTGIALNDLCSNQQINAILCKDGLDNEFIYYELLKRSKRFKLIAGEQAVPIINKSTFENFKILYPPIAEQRKISRILSTWDNAIEKQEKLIEALKKRKRGLMQQLLTGKRRLPGFKEKWRKYKLGDIGIISSAGVDKKSVRGELPVKLLNYLDIYKRDFLYSSEQTQWVTASAEKQKKCSIKCGDVFFTPSSETPNDIGMSAVAMEDMSNVAYSYHIVRFRLKTDWDLIYRGYAFKTEQFYKQAQRLCEGSGQRYVISLPDFNHIECEVPQKDEQTAIAGLLFSEDRHIEVNKEKLFYLKEQKTALMQLLLSGKTII